jgi:hypothetical protein
MFLPFVEFEMTARIVGAQGAHSTPTKFRTAVSAAVYADCKVACNISISCDRVPKSPKVTAPRALTMRDELV